jgi:hypothetical protein
MLNISLEAGAVGAGAGAASFYGSGSSKIMQLLAAPAPQHCILVSCSYLLVRSIADISDWATQQCC